MMLCWDLCYTTVLMLARRRCYGRRYCTHSSSSYSVDSVLKSAPLYCVYQHNLGLEQSVSVKPSFVGFWLKHPLMTWTFQSLLWELWIHGTQKMQNGTSDFHPQQTGSSSTVTNHLLGGKLLWKSL